MECASTWRRGKLALIDVTLFIIRLQLQLALQTLLNSSAAEDYEELLFWGKIQGTGSDYYIAMGVTYKGQYEFPTKTFYWCTAANWSFKKFRELNTQHKEKYNSIQGGFKGDGKHVYI